MSRADFRQAREALRRAEKNLKENSRAAPFLAKEEKDILVEVLASPNLSAAHPLSGTAYMTCLGVSEKIVIRVDPAQDVFKDVDSLIWSQTLQHEYHHLLRGRGKNYDGSLASYLALEALAIESERDLGPVGLYAANLSLAELEHYAAMALPLLNMKSLYVPEGFKEPDSSLFYNGFWHLKNLKAPEGQAPYENRFHHGAWFMGTHDDPLLPRSQYMKLWCGYTLANALLLAWKDLERPPAEGFALFNTKTETMMEPFRKDLIDFAKTYRPNAVFYQKKKGKIAAAP